MNVFEDCLEQSHEATDLPFWAECYQKAFPDMITMIDHRQDGEHQRAGIDRSLVLRNSKQILIDEKVRFRNRVTGKVYNDIALEEWSNYERGVPGWVCKPLRADFIAYAIASLGKCYLLPVVQLQSAWASHCHIWRTTCRRIEAKNPGYTTISWGVPVAVLFPAIGSMFRVSFQPIEEP